MQDLTSFYPFSPRTSATALKCQRENHVFALMRVSSNASKYSFVINPIHSRYQQNGASAAMAPPKLTLFLDIISPFAYIAFYVTKVF